MEFYKRPNTDAILAILGYWPPISIRYWQNAEMISLAQYRSSTLYRYLNLTSRCGTILISVTLTSATFDAKKWSSPKLDLCLSEMLSAFETEIVRVGNVARYRLPIQE